MEIEFEQRRIYVATRRSILFFARVGNEKIRCYLEQDALLAPARGLREEADLFQRCLIEFDRHRSAIESTAAHLIRTNGLDPDGAVTISRTKLALGTELPLGALARPKVSVQRSVHPSRPTRTRETAETPAANRRAKSRR